MALTVLMFVVLVASYALMFGLVKFTENVIAETRYGPASNGAAVTTEDTANTSVSKCHGGRVTTPRNLTEITMVSVYVLTLLVVLLVIYLFYAVINPQKF